MIDASIPTLVVVFFAVLNAGCDDEGPRSSIPEPDAAVVLDAGPPDVTPPDQSPPDAAPADAAADAIVDAGPPPRCSAPPEMPATPTGPLPPPATPARGIDAWEAASWVRFRDAALANPGVHFVATFEHETDAFRVDAADQSLRFRRAADGGFEILEGTLDAVFPRTDSTRFGDLQALLGAFEHQDAPDLQALGYAAGDPRVGWLPIAAQSWPDPLVRLATLFDAPHAPDMVAGLWPWTSSARSTHGGLGLLQSRSTLILSGRGARSATLLPDAARLVDVAPTVMAALGAPTTGGVGPDGTYDDGLYLRRQDGRVLWEALDPDPCVRPDHVVLVLFDGLLGTELNHQALAETPDVDLPTFRALARQGTVYQYGAVVGFPSVSAPGHMTAGTGLWPGHHGIVGNAFYDRGAQEALNPFALIADPAAFLMDPSGAFDFYDRAVAPGTETLAAAAHRAFGPWNPETGEGAYVAVINELAIGDADFTTLDFIGAGRSKASLAQYRVADNLAIVQARQALGALDTPVPTLLQMSLVSTDGAGESDGPHSPLVREVLTEMDRRMGQLVGAYDRAGVLDRTLFILVSDHGMELQDPNRATNIGAVVASTGLRFSYSGSGLFYLRSLEASVERVDEGVRVRIADHDTGSAVPGAAVTCADCPVVSTDAEGLATLPATAEISATHPRFNPVVLRVP